MGLTRRVTVCNQCSDTMIGMAGEDGDGAIKLLGR